MRYLRRHADVVSVVTFWNVADADSWLGADNYPLLFDDNFEPKPVYYKVRDFTPTKDEKKIAKKAKKSVARKASNAADAKAALAQKNFNR